MKINKSLLILLALLISQFSFSQNNPQIISGKKAHQIAPGAELIRIKSFSEVPNYIRFAPGKSISENKAFPYLKQFINSDAVDFTFLNSSRDKLGLEHKRFTQNIQGIPLEYSAYILHIKNNQVVSMNGNIASHPDLSGSFSISETSAFEYAKSSMPTEVWIFDENANHPYRETYTYPKGEKVYFPVNADLYSNSFRAAYKFDMFSLKPYDRNWVYVDAETGEILHQETRIHTADGPATAETAYSGTQTITTDSYGGSYRLRETGRGNGIATYNCQMTTDYGSAVDFTDSDNYWNNVNAELDQYATDAHFATEKTYDYYSNVHGRNSIDGNGLALNSYIHFNLVEYGYPTNTNAFWNGSVMTYGDGDEGSGITPLTTVDIAAHEITHGLTSYTCNLNYSYESGALNESFSDIFGTCVEFYAVPGLADWTIGEDIGAVFRSMADPNSYNKPDTYQGNYWHTDASDNGGVHVNMSVYCYWFYLVSEGDSGTNDNGDSYNITGIGMVDAADITFRLQTVYLTNTSEMIDARFYAIQSAVDFFGACSLEVEVVTNALYAVGLGSEYTSEVTAEFDATYTENCSAPFTVEFQNYSINGNSFVWDFGDGTTSTEVNPSHTYTTEGSFDVQLYADGGACGENTNTETDFVLIDPSIPCMILMPENGSETSEECYGTLYDAGGPDDPYTDNSDATYTIEVSGASQIVLDIVEFDIEPGSGSSCDYDYIAFYDGPNTSGDLINGTYYCNTTGNPGTISSTGNSITIEFHSDAGLSMNGFQIDWSCIQANTPPIADFNITPESSCTGRIQFTDESLNLPESWAWDFGDGNTSSEENPEHVYQSSGTYTVSLTATNDYGSDNIEQNVEISLESAPEIDDITVCRDSIFTIELSGISEQLDWFTDEACTDYVHSGTSWEHDPLTDNTTYYLREIYLTDIDYAGSTYSNTGGGFFGNVDYIHYLVFDAYQEFTLLSVEVNANGAGYRNIALRDAYANVLDATEVYIPDGINRIDLNLNVPIGEDLQLVGLGAPNLYRNSESSYVDYPYSLTDVLSITQSSASGDNALNYYYYFYDWEVQTAPCESETATLNISVEDCQVGKESFDFESINIYPNPTEGMLYFAGLPLNEDVTVSVYDMRSVLIQEELLSTQTIDVSKLSSGIYILRIKVGNQTAYKRISVR